MKTQLTIPEAAELLNIPAQTIHYWLSQRYLKSTRASNAPHGPHLLDRLELFRFLLTEVAGCHQCPVLEVPLADIQCRLDLQPRRATNQDTVIRYAEKLSKNEHFPPVVLVELRENLVLADGHHRVAAFRKAARKTITARIIKNCDEDDALILAVILNRENARQFSEGDMISAAMKMLQRPEIGKLGRRPIAKLLGCGSSTVQRAANKLRERIPKTKPGTPLKRAIRKLEEAERLLRPGYSNVAAQILLQINHLKQGETIP